MDILFLDFFGIQSLKSQKVLGLAHLEHEEFSSGRQLNLGTFSIRTVRGPLPQRNYFL